MNSHRTLNQPSPEVLDQLRAIVGPAYAISDGDALEPHMREWRGLYVGTTPLLLKPGSTDEVSQILKVAHAAGVGVVPQGGNTGLVGGQIPHSDGAEIVLSTARLTKVREVDAAALSMCVESGVTLAQAQATAQEAGRLFPLSLASEGTATIGGVLATNAGGTAVLAYGTARQLALGIEVVLADGSIWNGLSALKKDNTGYDLRDLFIGSEGTLGVVTAATLKLFPAPKARVTSFLSVRDLDALSAVYRLADDRAGQRLTAFEFMSAGVLSFVHKHMSGTTVPFDPLPPWSVLLELSGDPSVEETLEQVLEDALEQGLVTDAVIASSVSQQAGLWGLREACSEAQQYEGGSIKHDISVPVALIPQFLEQADQVVERVCPGARPVPFGHFGDGNVHYNVTQPAAMEKQAYLELWGPMSEAVHDVVLSLGGSISAEHGIGRLKRLELQRVKTPVELSMMRSIKVALDPKGILNPGKLL